MGGRSAAFGRCPVAGDRRTAAIPRRCPDATRVARETEVSPPAAAKRSVPARKPRMPKTTSRADRHLAGEVIVVCSLNRIDQRPTKTVEFGVIEAAPVLVDLAFHSNSPLRHTPPDGPGCRFQTDGDTEVVIVRLDDAAGTLTVHESPPYRLAHRTTSRHCRSGEVARPISGRENISNRASALGVQIRPPAGRSLMCCRSEIRTPALTVMLGEIDSRTQPLPW